MNSSELVEIFFEIDENQTGMISKKEMNSYLRKRDFDESEIENVMEIFEESNDEISFEEYCIRLGEESQDYNYPESHDKDIEIVNSKFKNFHKEWVVANIIRRAERANKDNKEITAYVKKAMDKQMEELWHCVTVKGQYWAFYSHEAENSIVLKYKNKIFILFKTPGL